MRQILALVTLLMLATPPVAQDVAAVTDVPRETVEVPGADAVVAVVEEAEPLVQEITDQTIDQFLWRKRLVVVFADTPRDPSFMRQMELLALRPEALVERDVLVLTDTDPAARTAIRTQLRPRGFALVLVDKDGKVMLRKPAPWDVREITRSIDKTPLRQQEMRELRDIESAARGFPQ